MGFCLGSANVGNSAAIEAPGPVDTAVEQIHSVWRGLRAAVAVVGSWSAVVRFSTNCLENLASFLVAGASKEKPAVICFNCGLHVRIDCFTCLLGQNLTVSKL